MKRCAVFSLVCLMISVLAADPPDWVPITGTEYSMVVMAEINFNYVTFEPDQENMAAAFGPGGESDCRSLGVWQESNPPYYDGFWYFTIVGNQQDIGQEINFKIYDHLSDNIYQCEGVVSFADNVTIGTPYDPFDLTVFAALGSIGGMITLVGPGNMEDVEIHAGNFSTHPGANGAFLLYLAPGEYEVTASLEGYYSEPQNYPLVEVIEDQNTGGLNFILTLITQMEIMLPESLQVVPGSVLSLPVALLNPDEELVEGIDLIFSFDETILTVDNVTLENSELSGYGYSLFYNNTIPGELTITIYANSNLFSGSGTIVFINFTVSAEAPAGADTEIEITAATINEQPVPYNSCLLMIIDNAFDISGNISYFFSYLPISSAEIFLQGDDYQITGSDNSGNYLFSALPGGNYFTSVSKNTDLAGLSGTDASRVARFSASLYEFNCLEQIAADVTMNGSISGTDASRIARYAAQIISDLNSGTDWIFVPEQIEECENWPPIIFDTTRVYQPLFNDMENQDFIGIRLGDVTGNWSPDSEAISKNTIINERQETSASLPEIEASYNESITVPLTVNDLEDLEGMDITITFDETVAIATGASIEEGILADENYGFQVNSGNPGQLILVFYANQDLFSGSGIVAYLNFLITGNSGDFTELAFTEFYVNETDYLENTSNGSISITTSSPPAELPCANAFGLIRNYPNPFNPETTITYSLNQEGWTELTVFNLKGEVIDNLIREDKSAGIYQITWNALNQSSGIYLVQLKNNGRKDIQKIILLK
ncbi:MAG: T9SS type A sorting domain-containing protein [Candidatus Cloacimonetes bacterium]|nr:T9SS type A sorting domain-containing protein [Candidatus Cloacimonadota bacterium]